MCLTILEFIELFLVSLTMLQVLILLLLLVLVVVVLCGQETREGEEFIVI